MVIIKKNSKFLSTSIFLILIILLISQVCYANEKDNTTVNTIILNAKNCRIAVQKSQNNNFQYDYDEKLFELTTKTEQNKLTITAKPKDNAIITWCDKIIISIPNNLTYKKIDVQNYKAGISLCEINAEINIVSNEGSTIFYIPKQLNHNITYTSNKGSGAVNFYNETDNYSFNLSQEESAVSLPFSDYKANSSTYTHVKGDGSSQINMNMKKSAFAARAYTEEDTVENTEEEIKTKLTFKYIDKLKIYTLSIDKNTLPNSMKDCKFYNMLNIDEDTCIDNIIQPYIASNQNDYDYEYIPLESEVYFGIYEKKLILLFNENKQLLGYATVPKTDEDVIYVHFHEYNQSK